MPFGIDIKGLDEIERTLKEMKDGLTLPAIRKWCQMIGRDAKANCPPEHKESISIEPFPTTKGDFNIRITADKEAIPHVVRAIRRCLSSMPITTSALFEATAKEIEKMY